MKGFLHILESVLASLLILSSLLYLYGSLPARSQFSSLTARDVGYNCLKDIDNQGLLRNYTLTNNTAGLNNSLYVCMPRLVNYTVSFCMGDQVLCSGYSAPGNRTVVLTSYMVAGEGSKFQPTLIKLYMWSEV